MALKAALQEAYHAVTVDDTTDVDKLEQYIRDNHQLSVYHSEALALFLFEYKQKPIQSEVWFILQFLEFEDVCDIGTFCDILAKALITNMPLYKYPHAALDDFISTIACDVSILLGSTEHEELAYDLLKKFYAALHIHSTAAAKCVDHTTIRQKLFEVFSEVEE
jgi:hypothetical protein